MRACNFREAALVDEPSLIEINQAIANLHRAETVRNHDQRQLPAQRLDRGVEILLGLQVERRGCLIEHQKVRLMIERPRNADPLALPARQALAVLAQRQCPAPCGSERAKFKKLRLR